ncbi:hypothetical protein EX895_004976 [Sporisorium graminicola]|uniref:Proteasome assembly chaperone 1 n=1 Tax=Sporisorium graminicola TaxID=280036 RepID=A0A4U7KP61_9BASI|nr:hypothetical protein EX895_004976 [Sporisorium graminicola]TKY86151.1 hypothetical protein EX895_004976 [Sporisorium graminicola]
MDFDPANRDVAAPRYELESGSEDEFQVADHGAESRSEEPFQLVTADGSENDGKLEQGSQLVVLIGHAGASLLSSLGGAGLEQHSSLRCGSEQHAAIASARSSRGGRVTVALVAPSPQLRSWRLHEMASTLIETVKPSSVVIVDSYSPQDQLYRDAAYSEEEAGPEAAIRYIVTPSYVAQHAIDSSKMAPLRSPESASGLGAAFLSKAVINNVPAILTLLEDVSFQSHIQLYGSEGASRLSPAVNETLSALTGLGGGAIDAASNTRSLLDFATSRRVQPAANLAVLGDGNMYI